VQLVAGEMIAAAQSVHPGGVFDHADRPRRSELRQLPPGASSPADFNGRWVVAQTLTNHERAVIDRLDAAGVAYFLPLQDLVKRDAAGKRRRFTRAVFPGYVFVCLTRGDVDRSELAACRSICKVLESPRQARLIEDLRQLHQASQSGCRFDAFPFAVEGAKCEITSGPLRGIIGYIVRRDGKADVLVLQVELLGQSIGVEIDPAFLDPM
jgi:transcription antitermination factor NusG